MTLLQPEAEPLPSRIALFTTWLLRGAVALVFVGVGLSKFRDASWVRLFGRIGLGQWFRIVTGAMQVTGGLLTLLPRATLLGLALCACTMAGAVVAWLTVLGQPLAAPIPGALFVILIVVAWREYGLRRR
jgi:uncharacterized membrane protein YphA (DoxX/SURF4 family)